MSLFIVGELVYKLQKKEASFIKGQCIKKKHCRWDNNYRKTI